MLENLSRSPNIKMQFRKRPTGLRIEENMLHDQSAFPLTVTVTSNMDGVGENGVAADVGHLRASFNDTTNTFSGRMENLLRRRSMPSIW